MRDELIPKLDAYLSSRSDEIRISGQFDCLLLSLGWVEQATGRKLLPPVTWDSEETASSVLLSLGHETLEDALDKVLEPIAPAFSNTGDIVALKTQDFVLSSLGIV